MKKINFDKLRKELGILFKSSEDQTNPDVQVAFGSLNNFIKDVEEKVKEGN